MERIKVLVALCVDFIDTHMKQWLEAKGGWVSSHYFTVRFIESVDVDKLVLTGKHGISKLWLICFEGAIFSRLRYGSRYSDALLHRITPQSTTVYKTQRPTTHANYSFAWEPGGVVHWVLLSVPLLSQGNESNGIAWQHGITNLKIRQLK